MDTMRTHKIGLAFGGGGLAYEGSRSYMLKFRDRRLSLERGKCQNTLPASEVPGLYCTAFSQEFPARSMALGVLFSRMTDLYLF